MVPQASGHVHAPEPERGLEAAAAGSIPTKPVPSRETQRSKCHGTL